VSVYAALRADGALTVMVINKALYSSSNPGATNSITVNLSNFANRGTAQLWRLAATNPSNQTVAAITRQSDVTFTANSFTFNAPMQSVQLFVIPPADATATTTTTLSSSRNPSAVGESVTFTATVSAATGTPSGIVTFREGTTVLGTATLNASGVAVFTTASLSAGAHTVTAAYGGATGFVASTSQPLTQTVATRPTVAGVVVGDGSAQRSVVRSLTVTFTGLVTLDPGAFQVRRSDGLIVTPAFTTATVAGQTVATLTFTGTGTESGSLSDGNWTLTIIASRVHNAASPSITMAADHTSALYRLFGDCDGDRDVDAADMFRLRSTFGLTASNPSFLTILDFDADGDVDAVDMFGFRPRFGTVLNP
jgi:hypothetical protein